MEIHVPDMVWTFINFFVFLAIINKFLYKPLLGMLELRKQEIKANFDHAETAKAEALKLKEAYTCEMQTAKQQAQRLLDKAAKVGEETRQQMIHQGREEAENLTQKAQVAIEEQKEQALKHIRAEVASLVVLAAGKVIDRSLTPQDHQKLIEQFIEEAGDVS